MEAGLSKYMGKLIKEEVEAAKIAEENNQKVPRSRLNMIIRRYAKAKGLDVSKLF